MKKFLLCGLTGVLLTGCSMYQPSYVSTDQRNKITVAETIERMELYVQPTGLNISARDQDAVSNFLYQYARDGQGPLYINIPSNAANGAGVQQANTLVSSRLQGMGIGAANIQTGQYNVGPSVSAPVIVSYRRLTTAPIDCQMGASLTHTSTNQPYQNFGCAQTANLAAMIDDPRQLLSPYDMANSAVRRRVTVVGKYENGEATASPRPEGQEVSAGGN